MCRDCVQEVFPGTIGSGDSGSVEAYSHPTLRLLAAELPKYLWISREIIASIQSGKLPAGSRVPSENELIKSFRVSNTTARKALQETERSGWVLRVRGKGTFVAKNHLERCDLPGIRFTPTLNQEGRALTFGRIRVEVLPCGPEIVMGGGRYALAGPVCQMECLLLASGEPVMREVRYISLSLCPDIHKKPLENSLTDTYEQDYGLSVTQTVQIVRAVELAGDLLAAFGLQTPTAAFQAEEARFCGEGLIVEIASSLYRGDRYYFSTTATR